MAYDVNAAIAEMQDHGFSDTASTRLLSLLNDAQYDICSREPWPFLEKSIDLTFDANNPIPTNWPTNFSKTLSMARLDATGGSLMPERIETLTKAYNNQLDKPGDPLYYYFLGTQLKVLPVPSGTLSVRMPYVSTPQEMDTVTNTAFTVPARHARAVTMMALSHAYYMEDDPELGGYFGQQAENRVQTMREDLWMRQYDRPDTILDVQGRDGYDFDYDELIGL